MNNKKYKFIGGTSEQARWGSCTGDITSLKEGEIYTLKNTEVHSWHTALSFEEVTGTFNSVMFEEIKSA